MANKSLIDSILGPVGKGPEKAEPASALHAVASELLDAIQAKDIDGIEAALRAAVAECSSSSISEE